MCNNDIKAPMSRAKYLLKTRLVYSIGLIILMGTMYSVADASETNCSVELQAFEKLMQQSGKDSKPHGWPSKEGWVGSSFGLRTDPFTGAKAQHYGIDIMNHEGAAVLAANDGVVTDIRRVDAYYIVDINHGNGYETRYARMEKPKVQKCETVGYGQRIGSIKFNDRTPFLHYEVRYHKAAVNPKDFLRE